MTPVLLPARLGRSVVTAALVLFAVWTLVYQAALLLGLPSTATLLVAGAVGVGALVLGRRLGSGRPPLVAPLPSGAASLAVLGATVVATGLALAEQRTAALVVAVLAAVVALVLTVRKPAPTDALVRLRLRLLIRRRPRREPVAVARGLGRGRRQRGARERHRPARRRRRLLRQRLDVGRRAGPVPPARHDDQPRPLPCAGGALTTDALHRGARRRDRPGGRHRGRHRGLRARRAGRHRARGARAHGARRGGPHPHLAGRAPRLGHLPLDDRRHGLQLRQLLRRADLAGQGDARLARPAARPARRNAPRAPRHGPHPPLVRRRARRRRRCLQHGRLPRAGARRRDRRGRPRPSPAARRATTRRLAGLPPRRRSRVAAGGPRRAQRGPAVRRGFRRRERRESRLRPAGHRPGRPGSPRRHLPGHRTGRPGHPQRRAAHRDHRCARRGRGHPAAGPARRARRARTGVGHLAPLVGRPGSAPARRARRRRHGTPRRAPTPRRRRGRGRDGRGGRPPAPGGRDVGRLGGQPCPPRDAAHLEGAPGRPRGGPVHRVDQ